MERREIILIDKPKGMSSFDIIRFLRKKTGAKRGSAGWRMGHSGTLDPLATGLMIIGVDAGTKKLKELIGLPKTYEASVLLGVRTATGDLEGEILKEGEVFKIRLAYLIKKQSSGVFSFLQFFLKPENLTSLKKTLKLSPSILRFLVIKLKEKEGKMIQKGKKEEKARFISVEPVIQKAVDALSNEELEKKIEEALK